jgi:hypothetical protein
MQQGSSQNSTRHDMMHAALCFAPQNTRQLGVCKACIMGLLRLCSNQQVCQKTGAGNPQVQERILTAITATKHTPANSKQHLQAPATVCNLLNDIPNQV